MATSTSSSLAQCFSDLSISQNHLEVLIKHRLLGATPRVSDSVSLEWGRTAGISNKFPADADVAGLGTTGLALRLQVPLKGPHREVFSS